MNVIGHAVDGDELLLLVSSNSGDVFVQGFLVPLGKETMSALHGKDHVNVDLGIGVGHVLVSLLTELFP